MARKLSNKKTLKMIMATSIVVIVASAVGGITDVEATTKSSTLFSTVSGITPNKSGKTSNSGFRKFWSRFKRTFTNFKKAKPPKNDELGINLPKNKPINVNKGLKGRFLDIFKSDIKDNKPKLSKNTKETKNPYSGYYGSNVRVYNLEGDPEMPVPRRKILTTFTSDDTTNTTNITQETQVKKIGGNNHRIVFVDVHATNDGEIHLQPASHSNVRKTITKPTTPPPPPPISEVGKKFIVKKPGVTPPPPPPRTSSSSTESNDYSENNTPTTAVRGANDNDFLSELKGKIGNKNLVSKSAPNKSILTLGGSFIEMDDDGNLVRPKAPVRGSLRPREVSGVGHTLVTQRGTIIRTDARGNKLAPPLPPKPPQSKIDEILNKNN